MTKKLKSGASVPMKDRTNIVQCCLCPTDSNHADAELVAKQLELLHELVAAACAAPAGTPPRRPARRALHRSALSEDPFDEIDAAPRGEQLVCTRRDVLR